MALVSRGGFVELLFCVAGAGFHGDGSGYESIRDHLFGEVAQGGLFDRKQSDAFDCRAADYVALFVDEELRELSGAQALVAGVGGARDDETQMPAGAGLFEWDFGEEAG
jgi:hypothetical protein